MKFWILFIFSMLASCFSDITDLLDFVRCQVCDSPVVSKRELVQGQISDCLCDFHSVQEAVNLYFSPLLKEITSHNYFKYFWVNTEAKCSYWDDAAQCFMEACAVSVCNEEDIPFLIKDCVKKIESKEMNTFDSLNQYGWISNNMIAPSQLSHLEENSVEEWIDIAERGDKLQNGVYVDLIKNPERFTGYSGENARRVWVSIQEENCFGEMNDECIERRLFYRLMGGLQSSISVHIAKEFYYPNGTWGTNVELFERSVGKHKDRLNNLYFTFLFVLRAVIKSKELFEKHAFDIHNDTENTLIKELLHLLVSAKIDKTSYDNNIGTIPRVKISLNQVDFLLNSSSLDQCRKGFDESILFQVNPPIKDKFWNSNSQNEKELLKEEFRSKFRNISKIMDCVSCEKCRLWGKLQIMGLGSAIKVLLTSEETLSQNNDILNRQEMVALINTLHQLTKSVEFTSSVLHRAEGEWKSKDSTFITFFLILFLFITFLASVYYILRK